MFVSALVAIKSRVIRYPSHPSVIGWHSTDRLRLASRSPSQLSEAFFMVALLQTPNYSSPASTLTPPRLCRQPRARSTWQGLLYCLVHPKRWICDGNLGLSTQGWQRGGGSANVITVLVGVASWIMHARSSRNSTSDFPFMSSYFVLCFLFCYHYHCFLILLAFALQFLNQTAS